MTDERHPVEDVLRVVDGARGLLGGAAVLALGVAFVVLGNTAGRLIGVALLALVAIPGAWALWKRS